VLKAIVRAKELEQVKKVSEFYPKDAEEAARVQMAEAAYAAPAVESEVAPPGSPPATGERAPVLKLGPDGRRGSGSNGPRLGPVGE
jgi:hypothetical protein